MSSLRNTTSKVMAKAVVSVSDLLTPALRLGLMKYVGLLALAMNPIFCHQ